MRSPFMRASEISCRYHSDNLDVFADCHEGRGCALEGKKGFLRALTFWILLNVSLVDGAQILARGNERHQLFFLPHAGVNYELF